MLRRVESMPCSPLDILTAVLIEYLCVLDCGNEYGLTIPEYFLSVGGQNSKMSRCLCWCKKIGGGSVGEGTVELLMELRGRNNWWEDTGKQIQCSSAGQNGHVPEP